jgi:hypothetical protein
MIKDKRIVTSIDKLVWGMRGVIDEMSPDERKRVLLSIRANNSSVQSRVVTCHCTSVYVCSPIMAKIAQPV